MSLLSFASAGPAPVLPGCPPSAPELLGEPLPGIRPAELSASCPWADGAFMPASIEGEAEAGEFSSGIESKVHVRYTKGQRLKLRPGKMESNHSTWPCLETAHYRFFVRRMPRRFFAITVRRSYRFLWRLRPPRLFATNRSVNIASTPSPTVPDWSPAIGT